MQNKILKYIEFFFLTKQYWLTQIKVLEKHFGKFFALESKIRV